MEHKNIPIPVIIVNWNGSSDTIECIHSLLKSEHGIDPIIYLVDNGSERSDLENLERNLIQTENIRWRRLPDNLGFARANNLILEELFHEDFQYVVLLNNDTTVEPDFLFHLWKCAFDNKVHLVASRMLNYYDRASIDNLGHQMLNTGEIIPIAHLQKSIPENLQNYHVGPCAGAALYSMEMLRKIGIFDLFFTTGYEDAELGLRATLCGYKSIFCKNAIVYHKMGRSISKIFDERYALMIQTAIWYTYFKLMPGLVILLNIPFIFFKQLTLFFINIIFMRWGYLRLQINAWKDTLGKNRVAIFESRFQFLRTHSVVHPGEILRLQRFFLNHDLKRFWTIYVLGNKSALDSYGGK